METSTAIAIIAEQLGLDPSVLNAETVFEDLGADSLDLFQIINALEEEFEIEFDNDEAEKIKTVGDAISYLKTLVE